MLQQMCELRAGCIRGDGQQQHQSTCFMLLSLLTTITYTVRRQRQQYFVIYYNLFANMLLVFDYNTYSGIYGESMREN